MKRFEYQIRQPNSQETWGDIENSLNKLGNESWELCSIIVNKSQEATFIFKRELPLHHPEAF